MKYISYNNLTEFKKKIISNIEKKIIDHDRVLLWEGISCNDWKVDTFDLLDDYTNYRELVFIIDVNNILISVKCFIEDNGNILPGATPEWKADGSVNTFYRVYQSEVSPRQLKMWCLNTNSNGNGPEKVIRIYGLR